MVGRNAFSALIILVVLALVMSGCVTPPKSQQGASGSESSPGAQQGVSGSGSSPTGQPGSSTEGTSAVNMDANRTATPVPDDTRFLVPVTPPGKTGSSRLYPVTPEITQIIWNEMVIYNNTIRFQFTDLAYEYLLTNPPLFIAMTIDPAREERTKWIINRTASREEENITVIQDKPQTWFEIKITNKDTGEVVKSDGYGGVYSSELRKSLTVSSGGKYLIEMNGNNVLVNITMKVREPAGA